MTDDDQKAVKDPGPHEKPVSLAPLDPDEAVADLLMVKPGGKPKPAERPPTKDD